MADVEQDSLIGSFAVEFLEDLHPGGGFYYSLDDKIWSGPFPDEEQATSAGIEAFGETFAKNLADIYNL